MTASTGPKNTVECVRLPGVTPHLTAGEWRQDNRPFASQAELDDLASGWARISVTQGSGVFAYASVIDNTTNDPSTVVMRR